ncbi:PREDICTED: DEP domain-containing protein 1A-like, partial [Rhagoletis zephyria]|uniref:DEP domain-containing protein 1A-like n=1 Tax=Rhagoletis zephyria TaxID=28612 RepID=UPI00081122A4
MAATSRLNTLAEQNNNTIAPRVNSNSGAPNEQFKATRIWNEILQAFYLGIELKKHSRTMKTYHDCFTASQAVDWLKNYLRECEHFRDRKVTRFQALNLLRKYHKSCIIERVREKGKEGKELQDNNELYRFSISANENLPFLNASRSEADLLGATTSEPLKDEPPVELTLNEKVFAYKSTIYEQMRAVQPCIGDWLKLEKIDGTTLYNNITRVNANGVVQLSDKTADLPHWIMSAMKCLANWPKASGSGNCLPKYPGFEYDVFILVRDYFINLEEPIIPFEYYKLISNTFDSYSQEAVALLRTKQSLPSFLKCNSALMTANESNNNNIIANDILNLPKNCVYETAFSGREPVTKIVPIDELSIVLPNYFSQLNGLKSVISPFNSSTCSSSNTFRAISTMPRSGSKLRSQQQQRQCQQSFINNSNNNNSTPQGVKNTSQMMSDILCLESPPESGEYMLGKDMSGDGSRRFYSLHRNRTRQSTRSSSSSQQQNMSVVQTLANSRKYYTLLQMILFTLPSSNRRHLQLLLRLFHKIIRNKELCILTKDSVALKEHIVITFTRSLFRCKIEAEYNELKAREFISFLIDECMEVFSLPEAITKALEKAIDDLKTRKNGQQKKTAGNFCQTVTNEEFEMQRDVLSEVALSELLESIMRDESMSERDKLKWIKQ